MFILFQHSESKKAITSGQVIQVKSPRFDVVDNENISLEHLAWALDPVIRDRFLRGNIALPGEKDATLQTSGLPEVTPSGSPVEYQVIDVKLEDGCSCVPYTHNYIILLIQKPDPASIQRYDQKLTPKRRQELAQAIVSFGGFVNGPTSVDGGLGRRPMDVVLEHWAEQLSPEDKAKLETNGEIDPSGAVSVEDASSSPGDVSKSPSSQEPQDFWFPRASQEESEFIGLSMESTPPFKSYAPSDPSVLAEALTPVQPDPRPPPPKSNPSPQPSKKERLLIAARKAAEAAALKEMQSSVISSVSSSDSVEIEEVTHAQSSGEVPFIASEVPHPEMQERTEGSAVPPVEPDEFLRRQGGDIPGSMPAVPEPKRPSARSWLKRWLG